MTIIRWIRSQLVALLYPNRSNKPIVIEVTESPSTDIYNSGVGEVVQTIRDILTSHGWIVFWAHPGYRKMSKKGKIGFPSITIKKEGNNIYRSTFLFVLPNILLCILALIRIRPNLVRIHGTNTQLGLSMMLAVITLKKLLLLDVPVLLKLHTHEKDYIEQLFPRWVQPLLLQIQKRISRFMALRANKIQSPTKWYRDVFCQWIKEDLEVDIDPSLVKHIPTFENIADFQAEKFQDWHIPQSANIVLYLGRCDPEKKIERLIQYHGALKRRLDERGASAEMPYLIITGAGPKHYIEKLKDLSATCSIANHVRFVGRYAHEVGMRYVQMPNVKVVVFPSDNETQGLCLGEAMQHKVCLVLEYTALEEVVELSELTIPNDPELFAEAVEVILSSEETRLALTQRLRQIATKYTDKDKYTTNLINISRELSRP